MTALINTNFRRDAGGDNSLGSVVSTVSTSEGEALRAREGGGTMSRPPLDSLPYQAWVACQSCREVLHASELDEHFCPGGVW